MLQLSFVNFKANSYVLVEGTESNDKFYIIQTGKVNCYRESSISGNFAKILGPGDFVGVIACMSGHAQTETVMAYTDVTAIAVRRDQYPELARKNTPIALKIVRYFAREMRMLNDVRTKITLRKSGVDTPEEMFKIAEFYEERGMTDIALYGYYQYLKKLPNGMNADDAKKAFRRLKPSTHAVYLEPNQDMLRSYPQNTMIFSDCQTGTDMFIIQSGSVKITKVVDSEEITLALLKKGDMFGEMALLDNKPRSANAIAHDDCKVMVVNATNFEQMVTTQPDFISRLSGMLADRVWSMYRQLVNGELTDTRERMIDMLALQIELRKVEPVKGMPYMTDFTTQDIVNMSGVPLSQQKTATYQLFTDQNIKVVNGKIQIPNLSELIKQAAFYRSQQARRTRDQKR